MNLTTPNLPKEPENVNLLAIVIVLFIVLLSRLAAPRLRVVRPFRFSKLDALRRRATEYLLVKRRVATPRITGR